MLKNIIALSTCALMLASCDTFSSKDPLPGKREDVFLPEDILKPEVVRGTAKVSPKKGEHNKEWAQPGGSLSNYLPAMALPEKPTKQWSTSIGQGANTEKRFISNLVGTQGHIFAMDTQGQVTAVSTSDGSKTWSVSTSPSGDASDTLGGGICYHDGKIYVATSFGDVLALDAKTGDQVWKQSLLTPIRIAPKVANGKIFVINIANEAKALDIKDGKEIWSHTGLPEITGLLGGGVPAISGETIYVPYSSGEVYALNMKNGETLWTETLNPTMSFDTLSSITHIRARPIVHDGTVYAISHGGRMSALNASTGNRQWQQEFGGIRTPAIYGNYLYMVSNDNELICLERELGKVVWLIKLKSMSDSKDKLSWAGPVIAGGHLVLTGTNGDIAFYSLKDGKLSHTVSSGDGISLSPVVLDGALYTLSDSATLTCWK